MKRIDEALAEVAPELSEDAQDAISEGVEASEEDEYDGPPLGWEGVEPVV